jgi:hypothetical protein
MTDERIVVRVDPEGQIHAETIGMKGQKCLDTIALLEALLEAQATSSAFTPEYYELTNTSTGEVDHELRQQ